MQGWYGVNTSFIPNMKIILIQLDFLHAHSFQMMSHLSLFPSAVTMAASFMCTNGTCFSNNIKFAA